jgi:hypothetical protein
MGVTIAVVLFVIIAFYAFPVLVYDAYIILFAKINDPRRIKLNNKL